VTSLIDGPPGFPTVAQVYEITDVPRSIDPALPPSDHVFRGIARTIGIFVLVLTGSIGLFLGYQAFPTLRHYGTKFFTGNSWRPEKNDVGIAGALLGTAEVALVAVCIGFPLALLTALYISEYAPARLKSTLVALIDLMAGVPSIIFGLWGSLLLEPKAIYVSRWISQNLGWVPFFAVGSDPDAASWQQSQYYGSAFIAGICVGMMIVPLACAVMRGVFAQAPIGEREAAYALGSTRWGMIRAVVLPFGRGGIIGGTMLGLGRALGETVAVLLVIAPADGFNFRILTSGTQTISALIANFFGEATSTQLAALLTAGFVLFVITLFVNGIAAVFVTRSRSGTATEI
jgi:phosphate transport system permease protein